MVLQKRDGFAGGRGENKTMQVRVCAWVCGDPGSGEHPGFTAGFQLVSFLISFPFLKIFFFKEEERTQRSERCHGPQAGRGCDKDPPGSRCCCPDSRHPQTSPLAFSFCLFPFSPPFFFFFSSFIYKSSLYQSEQRGHFAQG